MTRFLADIHERLEPLRSLAAESAMETLWPTRCAICDTPGEVLCKRCLDSLPYLDTWKACQKCGAPFGIHQCTECNSIALARMGIDELPFKSCVSAVHFSHESGIVVRTLKDGGEQRLAIPVAHAISQTLSPEWRIDAITFVPSTNAAFKRRGFDHAELIATELSSIIARPCISVLKRPRSSDQRELSRKARINNVKNRFRANESATHKAQLAPRVLLIDDVYTTGSTLCDAAAELKEAGFSEIRCATFARVY